MPLPKVHRNVVDQQGNIVPGVLCSVYNQGTGVLASLFSDDAGTVVLSNPMTNDAMYGSVKFYVNPGHYDMTFTKPGYTFEAIYDMQVPADTVTLGTMALQNANAVAITGGTATLSSLTAPEVHGGIIALEWQGNPVNGLYINDAPPGPHNGLYGGMATGAGRYNLYIPGTAPNYFGGPLIFADPVPTRTNLGLGTLATQNANAVAITGGTLTLPAVATTGAITLVDVAGTDMVGLRSELASGTNRYNLFVSGTAPNYLNGNLGLRATPLPTVALYLGIPSGLWGLATYPTDQANAAVADFRNQALASVGSITTNATATAYNTTSDRRLKDAIETMRGGLGVLQALRPVRFLWTADGSPGTGFVADEVQQVVPEAVTGEPDAVDAAGAILPQGMDLSKLVPYLTAACQELAAQLEAAVARIATLEARLTG